MYKLIFKRILDITTSLILLTLLLLPFSIIALLILLDDGGPIFFRQKRIGKHGKHFRIYKWKTMVNNAEQIGPFNTQLNDTRVTKTGKILRKTSIDETPQIINILLGQMSLIGPRPDVPIQEKDYTPEQFQKRHEILPGMTGLAQARNRHATTKKARLAYDLFYAKHQNFYLDMKIIIWTIKTILKGSY